MLVLGREVEQVIVIGDDIRITVVGLDRDRVHLGIEAPDDVSVDREEVRARKEQSTSLTQAPIASSNS